LSSLEKVFTVIETIVSHQSTGLNFAGVVAKTGLPKSTAHRILKYLTGIGYLSYGTDTKMYRGTLKLAGLGAEVMSNFDLRQQVHPQLIKLHQETEHTCNMGIKSGEAGIFVDKIESRDFGIKLFSEIGKSFPLHCTAMGKVLLAYAAGEETGKILSQPLPAYTDNTITGKKLLLKELEKVKNSGYAVDWEEITRGVMCVAAPVFGIAGEVTCAISMAFPSYIYSDRGIDREIRAIKAHAEAISGPNHRGQR
jgi:IclR family transcriptional regulator, KDG regulon repressor